MTQYVQKVGRNDPCPCGKLKPDGSPLKYKKCCWLKEKPPPSKEEVLKMAEKVLRRKQEKDRALAEKGIFINYVEPVTYTNPKTALGNG